MTKLNPELLKACASYLRHADTYNLDGDGQMELLRADASDVAAQRGWHDPHGLGGFPPQAACDELTHAHIEAIRGHARVLSKTASRFARQDTAQAILDATPAMLAWWCRTLAKL